MIWEKYKYYLITIIIYSLAFILSRIIRFVMSRIIKTNSKLLKTDPTNFNFLKNSLSFIIYTAATIIVFLYIPFLRQFGKAIFAGAGILAAIIGFASQKAVSNIISGILILVFKPFRVGDIIEIQNTDKGIVEEITLRHTIIKNYENRRVIIPNNLISDQTIINSDIADKHIRKHLIFSISYSSNIDKAISIIQDEAEKHPLFYDTRSKADIRKGDQAIPVKVISLGDFSVNLKAYIWTKNNDDAFDMSCDLYKSVKERFDREGVEIPYPYRKIIYKKESDLPHISDSDLVK